MTHRRIPNGSAVAPLPGEHDDVSLSRPEAVGVIAVLADRGAVAYDLSIGLGKQRSCAG
jgi:hypothetical protein